MSRITKANVDGIAEQYLRTLVKMGILPVGSLMHVQKGSATYGNSWGIRCVAPDKVNSGHGAWQDMPGLDFSGAMTVSDAYWRIAPALRVLETLPLVKGEN
jgi:hypothetical protein